LTHVACDRSPVFAYVLHFFKHRGAVFIRQSQKEIFYRPCSARRVIVTPPENDVEAPAFRRGGETSRASALTSHHFLPSREAVFV
jgi:hypothetical protein